MVAGAHSESDSATDAGENRCPQGVPKMSQIRSVGSGNVLHNANTDLFEVDAIVSFKASSFGLPVEKVGQALAECSMGCLFSKLVGSSPVDLRGHPIVCYNGELCTSVLRIPRAAFTYFPVLRKFLAHVTTALSAHRSACDIDNALKKDNHRSLIKITGVKRAPPV